MSEGILQALECFWRSTGELGLDSWGVTVGFSQLDFVLYHWVNGV